MEVQIRESKASNSPVTQERLIALIDLTFKEVTAENNGKVSNNSIVHGILEKLNAHSSLYKYVISITSIETDESITDSNFQLSSAIGSSWNTKKDGLFNHIFENDSTGIKYLITVIWISK
ncbi:hypothetical protein KAFR_0L01020 [Kazachstania africana CBS 2517]|uniref:Topoisomerase I damage affected protein 2 n=1 Tax=Kazachstania africana (strain ATCC 22294 / BCRC 22015 / CBS 2517 / CECT 1963 / NBRC 1671 / NRRL Y-8276) TaxID=1071382 RepID=H2B260_KAZAF|nr:hypothetical protein KAFR_0L01020 [Kazachstania africana CBS 2517]CCF60710.1 hypothetical protein KAFR_0L01020 [Kazachstania africana CBS 2517]